MLDLEPLEGVLVRSGFGGSHGQGNRMVGGRETVGDFSITSLAFKQKARLLIKVTSK